MSSPRISRRDLLKSAALGGMLAALPRRAAAEASAPAKASGPARNVIFLVADGMSQGSLAAANHYLNLTEDRDTAWLSLYRDGLARRSLMETRSASALVTDSAAASSAWGCGQRVANGVINMDADNQSLTPLYTYARTAGLRTGLVTTATVTHATPAGFAANVSKRGSEDDIARQYLERGVDVVLGGGRRFFDASKREDGADLFAEFDQAGYTVVRDRAELAAVPEGDFQRVLGTFTDSHMPYSVDADHDPSIREKVPPLSEMMARALDLLGAGGERFILQVEAARVDHGGHGNDPAALLFDLLEFDRCVALARAYAQQHGDTLVIVTTDHGTGGFMLNGYGPGYSLSESRFLNLREAKGSFPAMLGRIGPSPSPEAVAAEVKATLGVELAGDRLDYVMRAFRPDDHREAVEFLGTAVNLGAVMRPILYDYYAINWTGQNHTAEEVEFASFGPGSEAIPGFFENWEVNGYVRSSLGI